MACQILANLVRGHYSLAHEPKYNRIRPNRKMLWAALKLAQIDEKEYDKSFPPRTNGSDLPPFEMALVFRESCMTTRFESWPNELDAICVSVFFISIPIISSDQLSASTSIPLDIIYLHIHIYISIKYNTH